MAMRGVLDLRADRSQWPFPLPKPLTPQSLLWPIAVLWTLPESTKAIRFP